MKSCMFVVGLSVLICGPLQANLYFSISEEALLSGEFASQSWGGRQCFSNGCAWGGCAVLLHFSVQ